jgi:dipeptidyl aminopeptidase/acylaminoacyl peptidase
MPATVCQIADRNAQPVTVTATLLPTDFPSARLVVPETVTFKAEDGLVIHGQLFLPNGLTTGERRPAVIFTHGGSERQMLPGFHDLNYYHNAYAFNQYLASRGFVVLSVNYRSGIMYGHAFRDTKPFGWGGAPEYKDLVAGARYLQSRGDVDAGRIGLWGGSYGGYLTALGLARNSDLFKAGVDFHGVHDWRNLWSTWLGRPVGTPDEQKILFESSPNASIHGDDDRNVPFTETVDLVQRLRQKGVDVEVLVFPDEIHDLLTHQTWLTAYHASSEFLERRLGPMSGK